MATKGAGNSSIDRQSNVNDAGINKWLRFPSFTEAILVVAEVLVILLTCAIYQRPDWFASTAFDYLAAANPTFVLETRSGSEQNPAGLTYFPIIDPGNPSWQNCTRDDSNGRTSLHHINCAGGGSPLELPPSQVVLGDISAKNDDVSFDCTQNDDANTLRFTERFRQLRADADDVWSSIQQNQAHVVGKVIRGMVFVLSLMMAACGMLFAKDWYERRVMQQCGVNLLKIDEEIVKPSTEDTSWDHRVTMFFVILATAIIPVILMAQHYTSISKPLDSLLLKSHHQVSQSIKFMLLPINDENDQSTAVIFCVAHPSSTNGFPKENCMQWKNCTKLSAVRDDVTKAWAFAVRLLANGSVINSPHKMSPGKHDVSATAVPYNPCASHENPAECVAQTNYCTSTLVQELNAHKHLLGARRHHLAIQTTISKCLTIGATICVTGLLLTILCALKTIFLLSLYAKPLVFSRCRWLAYEAVVFLNCSNNQILSQQNRLAVQLRDKQKDE